MNSAGVLGGAVAAVKTPASGTVSVRKGFGWSLAAYLIYMACLWGMMVVLARWGAPDQSDVGLFAMALATTTPIVLFANLGLRRVYATDAGTCFRFSDYFSLRMVTNFAALAVIAGVIWLQGYRTELVWATLAMGAAKMIEGVSDLLHGFFQQRRRIDVSARSTMLRGVFSLAGFAAAFLATKQVFWGVIGMGAGWAVVLLVYEWPRATKFLREMERESGGHAAATPSGGPLKLALLTLPIGVVALVTSLKASIPTFVIESHLGEAALGVFAALIYFHHGANRVVSSLGEAAAARMAALHAMRDRAGVTRLLTRMVGASLLISAAGLAAAVFLGGPILRTLYGPLYAGLGSLLIAIMAAACVANVQAVFDYAMMAIRRFKIQPYMYGAGAGLLLLLCTLFVPTMGLTGAALALGIVSAAELLASAAIVGWTVYYSRPLRATFVPETR